MIDPHTLQLIVTFVVGVISAFVGRTRSHRLVIKVEKSKRRGYRVTVAYERPRRKGK